MERMDAVGARDSDFGRWTVAAGDPGAGPPAQVAARGMEGERAGRLRPPFHLDQRRSGTGGYGAAWCDRARVRLPGDFVAGLWRRIGRSPGANDARDHGTVPGDGGERTQAAERERGVEVSRVRPRGWARGIWRVGAGGDWGGAGGVTLAGDEKD